MSWKPSTDKSTGAADGTAASTTPARRRRRPAPVSETPLVDAAMEASPKAATGMRPPSGSKVNDDRVQRKVRLGKRWSQIYTDVKRGDYTWAEFCDGLDEQELARGQIRAMDGTFSGRPPSFVPREFLLACQREQKRRFEEMFGSEVLGLTKDFLQLCKDKSIPPDKRAKLLQYAMERVFGGIPKDVRVSQEQPYEQMMVNVVSDPDEEMPAHLKQRYATYSERAGGMLGEEE